MYVMYVSLYVSLFVSLKGLTNLISYFGSIALNLTKFSMYINIGYAVILVMKTFTSEAKQYLHMYICI